MAEVAKAGFGYIEGRQIKKAKDFEAEQLERAAIEREAKGTTQAYEQRKAGERAESAAIATMAASGGVVDSDIVAKLKSTTDYNVLSELFASKTESASMRLQAKTKRVEGKQAKRMAKASLITSIAIKGAEAAAGVAGPADLPTSTGVNLDYNRFAGVA
ncbi:hypothetical protein OAO65_02260 [Flavobacteriales bacterium]|nr:hypothetical protein [Flavobacteriales bacterium]